MKSVVKTDWPRLTMSVEAKGVSIIVNSTEGNLTITHPGTPQVILTEQSDGDKLSIRLSLTDIPPDQVKIVRNKKKLEANWVNQDKSASFSIEVLIKTVKLSKATTEVNGNDLNIDVLRR